MTEEEVACLDDEFRRLSLRDDDDDDMVAWCARTVSVRCIDRSELCDNGSWGCDVVRGKG